MGFGAAYLRLMIVGAFGLGLLASTSPALTETSPKFFHDDPLWIEPSSQDALRVERWEIDLTVDLLYNQFGHPGDPAPNVRAKNINTVDEVPDGSWFTNRAGLRRLTVADVVRGPDRASGPAPGMWTITSAKSDGITPGFTIADEKGERWFLKFDPPGHRGMATGTEVVVTKLFWALGYHVPENYVAFLHPGQLRVHADTELTLRGRSPRPIRLSDVEDLLEHVDPEADGSYRVVASRALEGKMLGGFRFYGTRPDDPNDIVPHEHRRELRGYRVFSAWLNHVDAKAINTMDALVPEDDRSIVRHNLLDFGSALGSSGIVPNEHWEGYEYLVQPKDVGKQMAAFGFAIPEWRKAPFDEHPAIGRLPRDNSRWDPDHWRARVPNAAFLRARGDDKFWAATKVAAITDEMIRAAVRTGQFDSEEAEEILVKAIIERRDAILRRYLTAVNPVTKPELSSRGVLTFRNAAIDAHVAKPPASYRARWSRFDNATGTATTIGETSGATTTLPAPSDLKTAPGRFVMVQLCATGGINPSWQTPVDIYFRRAGDGWQLVGFERMPEPHPPGSRPICSRP